MIRRIPDGRFVKIHSNRICHKTVRGKIGEVYYLHTNSYTETRRYGITINNKVYVFYRKEIEPLRGEEEWDDII